MAEPAAKGQAAAKLAAPACAAAEPAGTGAAKPKAEADSDTRPLVGRLVCKRFAVGWFRGELASLC